MSFSFRVVAIGELSVEVEVISFVPRVLSLDVWAKEEGIPSVQVSLSVDADIPMAVMLHPLLPATTYTILVCEVGLSLGRFTVATLPQMELHRALDVGETTLRVSIVRPKSGEGSATLLSHAAARVRVWDWARTSEWEINDEAGGSIFLFEDLSKDCLFAVQCCAAVSRVTNGGLMWGKWSTPVYVCTLPPISLRLLSRSHTHFTGVVSRKIPSVFLADGMVPISSAGSYDRVSKAQITLRNVNSNQTVSVLLDCTVNDFSFRDLSPNTQYIATVLWQPHESNLWIRVEERFVWTTQLPPIDLTFTSETGFDVHLLAPSPPKNERKTVNQSELPRIDLGVASESGFDVHLLAPAIPKKERNTANQSVVASFVAQRLECVRRVHQQRKLFAVPPVGAALTESSSKPQEMSTSIHLEDGALTPRSLATSVRSPLASVPYFSSFRCDSTSTYCINVRWDDKLSTGTLFDPNIILKVKICMWALKGTNNVSVPAEWMMEKVPARQWDPEHVREFHLSMPHSTKSYMLANLKPNTKYAIKATYQDPDSSHWVPYSTVVFGTTHKVSLLQINSLGGDFVIVSQKVPCEEEALAGMIFLLHNLETGKDEKVQLSAQAGIYKIPGLQVNTRYIISGVEVFGGTRIGSWSGPLYICVSSVPLIVRDTEKDTLQLQWTAENVASTPGNILERFFIKCCGVFLGTKIIHKVKREDLKSCNFRIDELHSDQYRITFVRVTQLKTEYDLTRNMSNFWPTKWVTATLCTRFVPQVITLGETMVAFYCVAFPSDKSWVPFLTDMTSDEEARAVRRILLMYNADAASTADRDILGFDVRLSQEPITEKTPSMFLSVTRKLLYILTGLQPGTHYWLSIRVHVTTFTGLVEGPWSESVFLTTCATPCIEREASGDDFAILRWHRTHETIDVQQAMSDYEEFTPVNIKDFKVPIADSEASSEANPLIEYMEMRLRKFNDDCRESPSGVRYSSILYEQVQETEVTVKSSIFTVVYSCPSKQNRLNLIGLPSGRRLQIAVRTKVLNQKPGLWSELITVDTFSDITAIIHDLGEDYARVSLTSLGDADEAILNSRQPIFDYDNARLEVQLTDMTKETTHVRKLRFRKVGEIFLLNNLVPDTPYKFCMRIGGKGVTTAAWSGDHLLHTLCRTCAIVRSVTYSSITVMWGRNAPREVDPTKLKHLRETEGRQFVMNVGKIVEPLMWEATIHHMVAPPDSEDGDVEIERKLLPHPVEQCEFTKLQPNTIYKITVRYTDVHGVLSNSSEAVNMKTLSRLKANFTAISEHYVILLITQEYDDGGPTTCEEMDFDISCSTHLKDNGEVAETPKRISVSCHSSFRSSARIIQGLYAGEYCFAAIRTKIVWRQKLFIPWLDTFVSVPPVWSDWGRPISIQTMQPLKIRMLSVTSKTAVLEIKRSATLEARSTLTSSSFRLMINQRPQEAPLCIPPGTTMKLGLTNLQQEVTYSLAFATGLDMLSASMWDAWWHSVRFRTQARRPSFPILYESHSNLVALFWRPETPEDVVATKTLLRLREPNEQKERGVTEQIEQRKIQEASLHASLLKCSAKMSIELTGEMIPPACLEDRIDDNSLLITPVPSVASTASTPDNLLAASLILEEDCEGITHKEEPHVYQGKSVFERLHILSKNIVSLTDDLDKSDLSPSDANFILSFLNSEIYSGEICGEEAILNSAKDSDGVEYTLEVGVLPTKDFWESRWIEVGHTTQTFARVILSDKQRLEDLVWRVRRRRTEGVWSVPSPAVGWAAPSPPSVCSQFKVMMITHASAELTWQPPVNALWHNQLIYNVWIQRLDSADDAMQLVGQTLKCRYALEGLHIATSYKVCVSASSTFGNGARCSCHRFMTMRNVSQPKGVGAKNPDQYRKCAIKGTNLLLSLPYPQTFERDFNPPYDPHDPAHFDISRAQNLGVRIAHNMQRRSAVRRSPIEMVHNITEKQIVIPQNILVSTPVSVPVREEIESSVKEAYMRAKTSPDRLSPILRPTPSALYDLVEWTQDGVAVFMDSPLAPTPPLRQRPGGIGICSRGKKETAHVTFSDNSSTLVTASEERFLSPTCSHQKDEISDGEIQLTSHDTQDEFPFALAVTPDNREVSPLLLTNPPIAAIDEHLDHSNHAAFPSPGGEITIPLDQNTVTVSEKQIMNIGPSEKTVKIRSAIVVAITHDVPALEEPHESCSDRLDITALLQEDVPVHNKVLPRPKAHGNKNVQRGGQCPSRYKWFSEKNKKLYEKM